MLLDMAKEIAKKEGYELNSIKTFPKREKPDNWEEIASMTVPEIKVKLKQIELEIKQINKTVVEKFNEVKSYIQDNEGERDWCAGFVTHNAIKNGYVMMNDRVEVISEDINKLQILKEDLVILVNEKKEEEAFERIIESVPGIKKVYQNREQSGRNKLRIMI